MNTTVNGSSCSSPYNPTAAKLGKTFAYCLIFVVSLIGNSFIAIIVYKTHTLRKPINFFIVNMAMSDLLSPIFLLPRDLSYLYADSWLISGPLGQALCKLAPFLSDVSTGVSVQSLVLIAVDRFGAVIFPLHSPLISSKLCLFFILATWIVAMAVYSPYLVAFKLAVYPGKLLCVLRWNEAFGESLTFRNYFLAFSVVFYYIPIVMLAILYSIIVIKLKSQKIPGKQSTNAEQRRAKRDRNVLKMAIAIVLGFVLCWVPLSICSLLFFFAWDSFPCTFFIYYDILWLMSVSNCAVNPCICFILRSNYRNALKRLLRCFN